MQTVMSNFIKLLFCLWQGACRDSFVNKSNSEKMCLNTHILMCFLYYVIDTTTYHSSDGIKTKISKSIYLKKNENSIIESSI